MKKLFFPNYFQKISKCVSEIEHKSLFSLANLIIKTSSNSKKVIIVGNGGSAAIASHTAVDFTKAAKIRAINFNEADLITCFANDYGYERWVEEAITAYADSGDMLILISSSGMSPNIVHAAIRAREMGLCIVTFSGFSKDNPLRKLGDLNFWVNSDLYNVIEMTHHIWLLSVVDFLISSK